MLSWCAYCQIFRGEVAPFESFETTHGICIHCKGRGLELPESELAHIKQIKSLQGRLWNAGRAGDLAQAEGLIEAAAEMGVRPIDLLVGLVSPALARVGRLWESGEMTVAEEHTFTAFCERLLEVLAARMPRIARLDAAASANPRRLILLAPCPGNNHTLGARIMDVWVRSLGHESQCVLPRSETELVEAVARAKPAVLGLSISLLEHHPRAMAFAARLERALGAASPRVVNGGLAVKQGSVPGPQPEPGENHAQMLIRTAASLARSSLEKRAKMA